MPLPYPDIPDLQPENWIDLDLLGSRDLETFIQYPGLGQGSAFWPDWRGCTASGEIVDLAGSMHEVWLDPPSQGEMIPIANTKLQLLDQGWVFYSYLIPDVSDPYTPGEESLRRFFYVGKRDRPVPMQGLGVAQFKESHDLQIDLSAVPTQATVVTPAYRAMSVGDRVELKVKLYYADTLLDTLTVARTLTAQDLGRPLEWKVAKGDLSLVEGGAVEVSYSIAYAAPTRETSSPVQRLAVVRNVTGRLPALTIKDFSDSALDPEAFPEGATLLVPLYAGIEVGDGVVVYADGATGRQVKAQRVDPTTLDSQVLAFNLEYAWLAANTGQQMTLSYTHARVASSGGAHPLQVMLRRPLNLPAPIVEKATAEDGGEGQHRGYLYARTVTEGVYVQVPQGAVIEPNDSVQMRWEGHASTGSAIIDRPEDGSPRRYRVPATAVPANIGKRVKVFYRVTHSTGEGPFTSRLFDLEVRGTDTGTGGGWPTIQVTIPQGDNTISLARVPESGAVLTLGAWMFMAAGQRVNVRVTGLNLANGPVDFDLRKGDQERVTESEYSNGQLLVGLPRGGLEALQLNTAFDIHVKTSFDDGDTYVLFPRASILLTA